MTEIVMVYITMPSEVVAKEIVRFLLEQHLIACATILPCKSMYWWDGVIQDDQELIVLAKTTEDKFELMQQEVEKNHPYKIPCILKFTAIANSSYAQWVDTQLHKNV